MHHPPPVPAAPSREPLSLQAGRLASVAVAANLALARTSLPDPIAAQCLALDLLDVVDILARRLASDAAETMLRMEAAGSPRADIVRATGRSFAHVRQVIWQARRDGLLPPKPETADQVEPQMDFEFSLG